jgi:hypothetical protein
LRKLNRLQSISANAVGSASALLTALAGLLPTLLTSLAALSALMLLAGLALAALTALLRIIVFRGVLLLLLALRVLLLVRHVDALRFR